MVAELGDGEIFLRPLHRENAADHLSGEDEAIAMWLSGGRSTIATVERYIASCEEQWHSHGPLRAFGIFDCKTEQLIGSIEANFAFPLAPGQVNVSFGVFAGWRGKGILLRALDLLSSYLRSATEARQMVVRISVANSASLRAIHKAGFLFVGVFDEPEGPMARYLRDL
jgi:RimJ/RimL family protein N-acetyltransferase